MRKFIDHSRFSWISKEGSVCSEWGVFSRAVGAKLGFAMFSILMHMKEILLSLLIPHILMTWFNEY